MSEIDYITDHEGHLKAVVIPIALWKQVLPHETFSLENLSEGIEDYCLNKAMEEAHNTPSLSREDALRYLEE